MSDKINVETAKTSELVAFYNEHAERFGKRQVTKFSDRQTAELRIRQLLADMEAEQEAPKTEPEPTTAAAADAGEGVYGFETHGLTHCPACGVHLSNGVGQHLQEVNDKQIKHEQFEFACLGCGAEFGPPIPGAHIPDEKRSLGVAKSWTDETVRAARTQRHAVEVDGVKYDSVMKAFTALGLPKSKLIRFRLDLKANGEQTFGKHTFKLVATK